jgi:dienelactone hydrolase
MEFPNRYAHMVHEYYIKRMRGFEKNRNIRISELSTRKDAERYVLEVKKAVKKSFGEMPENTPLNPRITGVIDCGKYIIEKVIFESRPKFFVTANLYLPKHIDNPLPGVVVACGHAEIGKAYSSYQSVCIGLVSKGFISLVYEPIGQGEARQYFREDGVKKALGSSGEHTMIGNQASLIGDYFGKWMSWDGIRALDYLRSRPEVDSLKIGVTGNSGGGTLSTYLSALDSRFCMAAPGCFITTYLANLENELVTDSEMNVPGIIGLGLDEADLLIAAAPRPTIILTQKYDYFDQRGARKAYADIKKIYKLLGCEKSISYFMGPQEHGFSIHNREAMYGFFMKHAGVKGSPREPKVLMKKPGKLFVTPHGSTLKSGGRKVFEFIADDANKLAKKRKRLNADGLKKIAIKCLVIPPWNKERRFRVLRPLVNSRFPNRLSSQFAVETEEGIQALVACIGKDISLSRPPEAKSVVLYVPHISSFSDLISDSTIKKIVKKDIVCAVDPRNIGESMPNTCGKYRDYYQLYCSTGKPAFLAHSGSDFMYSTYSDMFGEPLLGRRVYDVLCTMDFLLGNGAGKIRLAGRGLGSVIAAFAALLHKSKPDVTIWNYLEDFHSLTQVPIFGWPFSSMARGILKEFDLPDIYRVLGGRLKKQAPWNEKMKGA